MNCSPVTTHRTEDWQLYFCHLSMRKAQQICTNEAQNNFSPLENARNGSGADPAFYQWVLGSIPGIKWPWRDDDQSPPSSAEVKNEWRYTSFPLYVCMVSTWTSLPLPLIKYSHRIRIARARAHTHARAHARITELYNTVKVKNTRLRRRGVHHVQ